MALHRRPRPGSHGRNLGLYLLFSQLMQFGLDNIPPVTLALLGGQVAIFLDAFPNYFPSANAVCVSSYLVYVHRDWPRMILSTFYHAHDMHLYFNMVSLIYKGTSLERRFGSVYFAYLVSVFTALCSMTYVGIGVFLSRTLEDQNYLLSCAVGFSGVLFALKVLTTYYAPPGTQYVMGIIPIPYKYIYWVELVLIQLVTPNASFVGHLAGILVGVCYIYGPLKPLMDSIFPPGSGLSRQSSFDGRTPVMRSPFGSRLFGRGSSQTPGPSSSYNQSPFRDNLGRQDYSYAPNNSNINDLTGGLSEEEQYRRAMEESRRSNYDQNTRGGGLSEEEQYRRAMEESRRSNYDQNTSRGLYPNLDDLRSRRSNYYN